MSAVRLTVAWLLLSSLAAAQEPTPALESARGHFRTGEVYYASGDLRRALVEFLAARSELDRPELDYNIGLTYEHLGDAARAVEAYEAFLARAVAAPSPAKLELQRRLPALRAHVGTLQIVSLVAGATITLDDEPIDRARLAAPLSLTAGAHTIVAARDGMFSRRESVQIVGGQAARLAIDPRLTEARRRRLPGWAIGLITAGSVLVVGGAVTAAVLATRPADAYVGNAGSTTIGP